MIWLQQPRICLLLIQSTVCLYHMLAKSGTLGTQGKGFFFFWTTSNVPFLILDGIVKRHRGWKSTDPGDKIYALLGIAHQPSEVEGSFQPDYKKSAIALFRQFAKRAMLGSQKLRILGQSLNG